MSRSSVAPTAAALVAPSEREIVSVIPSALTASTRTASPVVRSRRVSYFLTKSLYAAASTAVVMPDAMPAERRTIFGAYSSSSQLTFSRVAFLVPSSSSIVVNWSVSRSSILMTGSMSMTF